MDSENTILNEGTLNTIQQQGLPGFKFANSSLGQIVTAIVPYVFVAAGLLLLVYIVIGGYSMMTSQGDPKALASARAKITTGLIGFVIVFASYWIVQAVGVVLGLPQFGQIFGGQ